MFLLYNENEKLGRVGKGRGYNKRLFISDKLSKGLQKVRLNKKMY